MSKLDTYVRFDTSPAELTIWAARTGLDQLRGEELEAVYTRAHDFICENKDRLVKEYDWIELEAEGDELFRLCEISRLGGVELYLFLPTTFASLMNSVDLYEFKAQIQRPSMIDYDLIVAGPKPLCNIFYMLQCIAPGILLLGCSDENEGGRHFRALPIESWVSSHEDTLTTVLGSAEVYQDLLKASREYARSFYDVKCAELDDSPYDWVDRSEWYVYEDNESWRDDRSSDRSAEDFAACGSDCGWCGHCYY